MSELDPLVTAKLVAINETLSRSGLPYAFGGAVALGYCVMDPRGTSDLDINVFVEPSQTDAVLAALPQQVRCEPYERAQLERDAQARLHWGDTPVDLFLTNHEFHLEVMRDVTLVPFGDDATIPVLSCGHLAVFKTFFARSKDFVDIASMVEANAFDVADVRKTIGRLLGPDATQLSRFDAAVADGRAPGRDKPQNRFPSP